MGRWVWESECAKMGKKMVLRKIFLKVNSILAPAVIVTFCSCLLCLTTHSQSLFDRFHQLFSNDWSQGDIDIDMMKPGLNPGGNSVADNVEFLWKETDQAHVLLITPKGDKDTPLDISIENGLVKVSGKVVKEEIVERDGMRSQSSYLSQFSLAEGIPKEADESQGKIEQEGQSIKITFPKRPGDKTASPQKRPRKNLRDINISGDKI